MMELPIVKDCVFENNAGSGIECACSQPRHSKVAIALYWLFALCWLLMWLIVLCLWGK